MRKLTLVAVVVLLCLIGFAFYRGWFVLSHSGPDTQSNKINVNLTVDPDKAKDDAGMVKNKATELAGEATEGT